MPWPFLSEPKPVPSSAHSVLGKGFAIGRFHGGWIPQPIVACSCQSVIARRSQRAVFLAPYPVHGLAQMFGNMKFVVDDLFAPFLQVLAHRGHVRIPHIHGYRLDTLALPFRQRLPESI